MVTIDDLRRMTLGQICQMINDQQAALDRQMVIIVKLQDEKKRRMYCEKSIRSVKND